MSAVGEAPGATVMEEPGPRADQALVAVTAASLNPVEIRVAAGRMGEIRTPYVPGLEGVGTVVRSPSLEAGTRVRFENHLPGFGKNGAIAELVVVDEDAIVELPAGVGDEVAAAAGVVGITASLALRRAGMSPGDRVAVLGATGGVGQMAVQLARTAGAASVVAVGRDAETLERVRSLGADASVNLNDIEGDDLTLALRAGAGGDVDIVVDTLWGVPGMAAIGALGAEGRLVNVGNSAGVEVDLPLQAMRQNRSAVIGLSSGWTPLETKLDAYRSVVEAIVAGDVTVDYEVVPLDGVGEAWVRQASSPHRKLVISLA